MSYKIDFGIDGGGEINFQSHQQLIEYLEKQVELWSEISDKGTDNRDSYASQKIINRWSEIKGYIIGHSIINCEQINSYIKSGERTNNPQIAFNSPKGKRIVDVIEALGGLAGRGAAQVVFGGNIESNNPNVLKGAILYSLFELGLKPTNLNLATNIIRKIVDETNTAYNNFHAELETKSDSLISKFEESTIKFEDFVNASNKKFDDKLSNFDVFKEDSKKEWEEIKKNFNEYMILKAPVEYWKSKAEKHEKNYKDWQLWPLLLTSVGGMIILAILIYCSFEWISLLVRSDPAYSISLLSSSDLIKNVLQTKLLFSSAIGLFFITLYIWAIRFVLRMVMTEHHLGIDARSRETMAMTYLALNRENAADERDKAIVLAALFKPVLDGLVKDDGMPTITPASLVQNMLTK